MTEICSADRIMVNIKVTVHPNPYEDGFLEEGVFFLDGLLLDVGSDVSESCDRRSMKSNRSS